MRYLGRQENLQPDLKSSGILIMFDINLLSYAFGLGFLLWLLFK